jgi:hypothetical protein
MRRTTAIVVGLIMVSLMTPALVSARTPPGRYPEPPAPRPGPGSVQINMTDVVPSRLRHRIEAGTPQVLRYRNMVMEVTANRQMTMNVSSDDAVRLRYLRINMTMTRSMHLDVNVNATPPTQIQEPRYGLEKYLTIEPNSTGPVRATLRLYIDGTELSRELNRTMYLDRLTWCYWNGTDWDPVRSRLMEDGFLEANTTHFSVWTIKEQRPPREMPTPDTPGVPAQTRAYNYTDVVPDRFQYRLEQRQGTMLQFQNTAMYFNCTKEAQLEITAESQFRQRLFRLEAQPGEALKLEMNMRTSRPTEVEEPEKHMGFYCEIEPNATITRARLGVEIDPEQVQTRDMAMDRLTWAYWNGTHWDPVESTLSEDNILEAETDHFSVWSVIEEAEPTVPEELPEEPDGPNYMLYGAAALVALALAGYLMYARKG